MDKTEKLSALFREFQNEGCEDITYSEWLCDKMFSLRGVIVNKNKELRYKDKEIDTLNEKVCSLTAVIDEKNKGLDEWLHSSRFL